MNDYWVYILTNLPRRTVLYIGVTNSIEVRLAQHREGVVRGFAWRNNTFALVYYEHFPEPAMAIEREEQLKRWLRSKKEKLINRFNPHWRDLSVEMFAEHAEDIAGGTRGSSTTPLRGSAQNDGAADGLSGDASLPVILSEVSVANGVEEPRVPPEIR